MFMEHLHGTSMALVYLSNTAPVTLDYWVLCKYNHELNYNTQPI